MYIHVFMFLVFVFVNVLRRFFCSFKHIYIYIYKCILIFSFHAHNRVAFENIYKKRERKQTSIEFSEIIILCETYASAQLTSENDIDRKTKESG